MNSRIQDYVLRSPKKEEQQLVPELLVDQGDDAAAAAAAKCNMDEFEGILGIEEFEEIDTAGEEEKMKYNYYHHHGIGGDDDVYHQLLVNTSSSSVWENCSSMNWENHHQYPSVPSFEGLTHYNYYHHHYYTCNDNQLAVLQSSYSGGNTNTSSHQQFGSSSSSSTEREFYDEIVKSERSFHQVWDNYDEHILDWKKKKNKKLPSSLNLNLNYQDVLEAWSDRGPPWADSNHMNEQGDVEVPMLDEDRIARREASVIRYKEKRHTRLFSTKIRYQVRKLNADNRPRLKGRFVKRTADKKMANQEGTTTVDCLNWNK